MVSLLDFSCRYDDDINDNNNNYEHQLNGQLHRYQLQSLRSMSNEENDKLDFVVIYIQRDDLMIMHHFIIR